MTQAARKKSAAAPAAQTDEPRDAKPKGRRIQVRNSGVHGRGVYAVAPIAADDIIIEYTGERISWDEAMDRHPHDPRQPNHTFYFHIDDGRVIDALHGGNSSRWINHACEPNCEADEVDGRVYIKALVDISPGEELFYDYGLTIDERYTPKLKKEFACHCGSPHCRGTMLTPKRQLRQPRK
ncbi:SET domain-containing protein [Roseateles koreensis]|uniref:SET domain-containing protein-lysine N-methyltransferase n=1 Tax=Roseateles koreensis TaxID=2987526 RepID=A0ABT5KWC4_9BURK|nr:SET domain-containing protein-lysine N-methyltransferase [Roseateles koreensis]MDC8787229.1 SET domain-containing protein-lysine N-methyltransferase [Roseateles koreensis]